MLADQKLLLEIGKMPLGKPHNISVDEYCEISGTTRKDMNAILLNFHRLGYIDIILHLTSNDMMILHLKMNGYKAANELSEKLKVRALK